MCHRGVAWPISARYEELRNYSCPSTEHQYLYILSQNVGLKSCKKLFGISPSFSDESLEAEQFRSGLNSSYTIGSNYSIGLTYIIGTSYNISYSLSICSSCIVGSSYNLGSSYDIGSSYTIASRYIGEVRVNTIGLSYTVCSTYSIGLSYTRRSCYGLGRHFS